MASFGVSNPRWEISRRAVVIDSNVLIAAFRERDQWHDVASAFLDEPELYQDSPDQLVVPSAVVVESWGFLVGRDRRPDLGYRLLDWLTTPGRALILPEWDRLLQMGHDLCRTAQIDVVDGVLFSLAHLITDELGLASPLRVATLDTRDYTKCTRRFGLRVRLLDLRSDETY